jgi:NAD(P)-dependent dehydrogenase (short-subunit alcohol dehydrogenase family)
MSTRLEGKTALVTGATSNIGSWVAGLGIPVGALYASTKGAMETLTRAWAGGTRLTITLPLPAGRDAGSPV